MTSRQTRSQGSAPDIPLPTTSRHSSAHPSGTQTPTPPVSSTSQAQPPDPLFQNPLPFPLDPIMSDAGENARTDVRDTAPTPPSSPPSTSTSSVALSMPENTNPNYVMPLSDINKAFDSLTVLTGSENWKMWYFHINNAIRVIRHQHFKSSGLHPGNTVKLACFNAITGKIDDKIMIHYIEELDAIELINKLKQCFDPSSTVQESNELWKLFNLRKPVWEFDKLLDEAQDLWASIKKRDIDVSDQVFYSALVGIIPPHYHFVRSSYEATVDAAAATWDATTAAEGEKPVYRAVDLIARLKKEFTNYRLSNARTYPSKKSDKKSGSTSQGGAQRSDKSKGERANAAAPFQKPSDVKKDQKCFNCNKMGHTTQTCPEPWTEKSKEAMKKKGITKQSNKGKTKENASVAISMPTSSSSQIATTSTSQSDWVQSISSGDVEMEDSETPVSHHISLPAFTAISDQDHTHIIDSGATIHCTPYLNLLFNVHTTPAITLTVANSEHLDLRLAGDMRVEIRKDNARTSKLTPKGKRGVWNTNLNQMDVDEDETKQPDGPRRSKRIQEARGLLYDEVEQNIAFFLTEFNVYYADNVGDPISFKDVLNHPQPRYLNDPGEEHYAAAKQCYLYLKGTCDYWLNLGSPTITSTYGFADSDGMSTYGNKPMMGYAFKFAESLISWSSKRGTLVTLSVTEAELCALAHASQEAIYLKVL
ncbi:hypothetical protein D9758_018258 [Tetrapyrgos nigripes]|uniref:CCHC-type domain-containing protein n=1 Tax=Tetrapyrgos nigripes TaxID=182062 RepID=A0A8H5FAN3_9AGAR|nr:hypothetical protein D9758_018258 [Tetrapyrgos nigripes]